MFVSEYYQLWNKQNINKLTSELGFKFVTVLVGVYYTTSQRQDFVACSQIYTLRLTGSSYVMMSHPVRL